MILYYEMFWQENNNNRAIVKCFRLNPNQSVICWKKTNSRCPATTMKWSSKQNKLSKYFFSPKSKDRQRIVCTKFTPQYWHTTNGLQSWSWSQTTNVEKLFLIAVLNLDKKANLQNYLEVGLLSPKFLLLLSFYFHSFKKVLFRDCIN